MTVLFGFTSPSRELSVLCADDLEGHGGGRAEKVMVVFDRYAVGVVGPSALLRAVANAASLYGVRTRTGGKPPLPDSVAELCDQVARLVPRVLGLEMKNQVASKNRSQQQIDEWKDQSGSLIVVDLSDHTLHFAKARPSVGAILGGATPAFGIKRLDAELVYEFSGTEIERGTIPEEALIDHRAWGEVLVADAASRLNQPKRIIGRLGTSAEGRWQKWFCWSAYDSVDERMTSIGYP
jgi:hypothetical protein